MNLQLCYYGNEVLRHKAAEVAGIDQGVIDLFDSMFNVMQRARGIGLAAPQVGISQRIIVVDIESFKGPALALANPVITETSEELAPYEEGCLSVPGVNGTVVRPAAITVQALFPDGNEARFDAEGLLARVLQHEIDHINGILFVDHLEDHVRKELTPELKKIKKLNKGA